MIRIIKGTVGYFDGRRIRPLSSSDGEISIDPSLEERFVKRGVAVYVTPPKTPNVEPAAHEKHTEEAPEIENNTDYESMSYAQLRKIATELGINVENLRSKVSVIAAIAKQSEPDDDAPEIGVQDPI